MESAASTPLLQPRSSMDARNRSWPWKAVCLAAASMAVVLLADHLRSGNSNSAKVELLHVRTSDTAPARSSQLSSIFSAPLELAKSKVDEALTRSDEEQKIMNSGPKNTPCTSLACPNAAVNKWMSFAFPKASDSDCDGDECDELGGDAEINAMAKALKKKLSEMKEKFRLIKASFANGPAKEIRINVKPRGPRGPTGPPGVVGPTGIPGPDGGVGKVGRQGPQGPEGIEGVKGRGGAKGFVGSIGKPGKAGGQGPKGMLGQPGFPGPKGPRGLPGAPGVNGANGKPGVPGPPGMDSGMGPPGPPGIQGPPGKSGKPGPPGQPGPPGDPGQRGESGATGPAGPSGTRGVNGVGPPRAPAVKKKGPLGSCWLKSQECRQLGVAENLCGKCKPADWRTAAKEGELCKCTGMVRYGNGNKWSDPKYVGGSTMCNSFMFENVPEKLRSDARTQELADMDDMDVYADKDSLGDDIFLDGEGLPTMKVHHASRSTSMLAKAEVPTNQLADKTPECQCAHGFKLKNRAPLEYRGGSFDDHEYAAGSLQPQNVCLLARFGNDYLNKETKCADEGGTCTCSGLVRFGKGVAFSAPMMPPDGTETLDCTLAAFGSDPVPGVVKECMCSDAKFPEYPTAESFAELLPETKEPTTHFFGSCKPGEEKERKCCLNSFLIAPGTDFKTLPLGNNCGGDDDTAQPWGELTCLGATNSEHTDHGEKPEEKTKEQEKEKEKTKPKDNSKKEERKREKKKDEIKKKNMLPPVEAGLYKDGKSILNIHCATWRDDRGHKTVQEQKRFLAKCMAQDCEQSLEGEPTGCRFMDELGLCYVYETAQQWCAKNLDNAYCNDGGEEWAVPPVGTNKNGALGTSWLPKKDAQPVNPTTEGDKAKYSCSCMKNCSCKKGSKCWCVDKDQKPVGFNNQAYDAARMYSNSKKKGMCACACGDMYSQ